MLVPNKRARVVGNSLGLLLNLLIVGGIVIAVLGPNWGIILTVGVVVAYFLLNLVVGVVGYRSVMRPPGRKSHLSRTMTTSGEPA
jgi:hypothetical protein